MLKITHPTLLVDKRKCLANINRMAGKARKNKVIFRPHFKTHQSADVGEWFRQSGVKAITVSSVTMARFFANHGWDDITIAFPVNILEIDEINDLASRIHLNLLVESHEVTSLLAKRLLVKAGFFIKIDTGYHRTGLDPENIPEINAVINEARQSNFLEFRGFLTHTGQTYYSKGINEIRHHHESAGKQLLNLKDIYITRFPGMILSTGDTPSCSLFEPVQGIDEIRPGNFVFYDLMQYCIGSCRLTEISVAAVCPVVALHEQRREAVLYGGAVHLSKEYCKVEGRIVYGLVVKYTGDSWDCNFPLGYLTSISQEHGIMKMNTGTRLHPGDLVAVMPVHSCLTADLMKEDWIIF